MNILILHSAGIDLIKEICKRNKDENNIYILSFKRNKGSFKGLGEEIFFKKDSYRMSAYKIFIEINKIIRNKKIDTFIGVYGNKFGDDYENLRVLMYLCKAKEKIIYNNEYSQLEPKISFRDLKKELYYSFEKEILKLLYGVLLIRKKLIRPTGRQKNKIMFVYDKYAVGGLEMLMLVWGEKLVEKGYEVSCVCGLGGGFLEKFMQSKISAYCMETNKTNLDNFDFYRYLKRIISIEKPYIVVNIGSIITVPAVIAAALGGVPKMIKMYAGEIREFQNCKPTGLHIRNFQNMFIFIHAVINSCKKYIESLGINSERINVYYNSTIDVNDLQNMKFLDVNEMMEDKKYITCVSRLTKEKGVEVFIKSISYLDSSILEKCKFVIVGDGEEREYLTNLSKKLDVYNNIVFLGFRNDVYDIIHRSYLTVLSSHSEGLGISILESFALSKICIGSNVGGIPEVITDGENGYLFEDNNAKQLSDIITHCLKNENKVMEMEKNTINTLKNKFDINLIINNFIEDIEKESI